MLQSIPGGITAAQGYQAAGIKAGIKKSGKEDLALIYSIVPAAAAAVFTTNAMAAAPVIVSKRAAAQGSVSAIIVNAGCANACTGEQGLVDAQAMAHMTAELLNVPEQAVLVASTGIIGVPLPMGKVADGIRKVATQLSANGNEATKKAIMTTDTFPKESAYAFTLGGKTVHIGGIAKGSGMIHPNMATMLGFITTDADVSPAVLQQALKQAVDTSFHMISVDGDTSTNDMVAVLANGLAGNPRIDSNKDAGYAELAAALTAVCTDLAKLIARDGEGATKFLEINVSGAVSFAEAKQAAMTIAKSPLVKTAFFGEDPNWGRIVCAAGYAGVSVDPEKVTLSIGNVQIVSGGLAVPGIEESMLKPIMAEHDISMHIDLGVGDASATVWTCDLSYGYVKINGEYHT